MKRVIYIIISLLMAVVELAAQGRQPSDAIHGCYYLPTSSRRVEPSLITPYEPPRTVRVLFVGDVMQHMPQVNAARCKDGSFDYAPSLADVKPLFDGADLVVVNLETTLTAGSDYSGYPAFRSPAALAHGLRGAGVDVCVLANNHCCDAGATGVRETVAILDSCGIAHTGVFVDSMTHGISHPLRLTHHGVRITLLNYTYSTNGIPTPPGMIVNRIDTVLMAHDLAMARSENPDCVAVFMHWGDEYARRESSKQRQLAHFLRRHGADLVIGSHPHVVQRVEADTSGVVIYSLGNFVSNQRMRYSDGGVVAEVDITRHHAGRITYDTRLIPVWVRLPDYRILTPAAADTTVMSLGQRAVYDRFMADTREIIGVEKHQ